MWLAMTGHPVDTYVKQEMTLMVIDVGSDIHDSEPKRIKNFLNLNVVNAILISLP
jgi:hypothetical protein